MEAVGLAGSIVALIEATAVTIQYLNSVQSAPKDRAKLAQELSSLLTVFWSLQTRLEDASDAETWSSGISSLAVPGGPLSQLRESLEEIQGHLKHRTGIKELGKRFMWKWDEAKCREILQRIERNKSTIQAVLDSDSFNLMKSVKDDTADLKTSEETKSTEAIIKWLSTLNFLEVQDLVLGSSQEGTGTWLLESETFRDWVATPGAALWCPGIPGAGKTVLTSIIINHLQEKFQHDITTAVCCIYFEYGKKTSQTPNNVFKSLLRQLLLAQKSAIQIPEAIRESYQANIMRGTSPSLEDTLSWITLEIQKYTRVFILVDALDECPEDSLTRSRFLKGLLSLLPYTNLLVTSRPHDTIARKFVDFPRLDIEAKTEDLTHYLTSRMATEDHLSILLNKNERTKAVECNIIESITDKSKGMFLIARLHMDTLASKRTLGDVKRAMKLLPESLDAIYNNAMDRIISSNNDDSKLGIRVLQWVTFAERQLTLPELRHALAIQIGATELDEDDLHEEENLNSVCAGLVVTENDSVRLVHYTTQEYLARIQASRFPTAETDLANSCLAYLMLDVFGQESSSILSGIKELCCDYPFLRYSASYWGNHARRGQGNQQLVRNFLEKERKMQFSLQIKYYYEILVGFFRNLPQRINPLHMISEFGLGEIMAEYIQERKALINDCDTWGRSPLYVASLKGFSVTVEVLLKHGAYPYSEDIFSENESASGRTALSRAAGNGFENIVTQLLKAGAMVSQSDDEGATPLHYACANGHKTVIETLLEFSADVNGKSRIGETALHWATSTGERETVRLLLEKGASIDAVDDAGLTPLHHASGNGHSGAVGILLEHGASLAMKSRRGETALWAPATEGDMDVLTLLLDKGANINVVKTDMAMTPLHYTSWRGPPKAVKVLLDLGADLTAKTNVGTTALHLAVIAGQKEIVCLLLERRNASSPIFTIDNDGYTPLARAIERGDDGISNFILKWCANNHPSGMLNHQDYKGLTLLHYSAIANDAYILQLLFDKGVTATSLSYTGKSALDMAIYFGCTDAIEFLLQKYPNLGLAWDSANQALLRLVNMPWYSKLDLVVHQTRNTLLSQFVCVASAARADIVDSNPQEPYLEVDVPLGIVSPVCRIEFRTNSEIPTGYLYPNKFWFEAGIKENTTAKQCSVSYWVSEFWGVRNNEPPPHLAAWGVDHSGLKISEMMSGLKGGSTLQVFARTNTTSATDHEVTGVEVKLFVRAGERLIQPSH